MPFIYNHSFLSLVLWKDLEGIENKSILDSIKKYSQLKRCKMEGLSKKINLYYLLAILNSSYAAHLITTQKGSSLGIYSEHIRHLPIPIASAEDIKTLSDCAKEELRLHTKLKEIVLESDEKLIKESIRALDAKIDDIVYKIYEVRPL